MKLFGFNIRISRPGAGQNAGARRKSLATDWLQARDLDEPRFASAAAAYPGSAWVYRAINVMAEQVANIPFLFSQGQRGAEQMITSGPLLDFYRQPHPQVTRFEYWELRIMWLMLRGECFRVPLYEPAAGKNFKAGQGPRRLKSVVFLDPAQMQHLVADHQLIGWRYTGWGGHAPLASQVFLPEEVWFEKLPNPFDFWRGLPPLHAAAAAARTDFAASAFMRGMIENNADCGVIVRSDKPLGPEQEEQLLAMLRSRKRKAGMADRAVVLSGCTEVVKPQLSSTDLQFLENRKFSRAEICAAFGVPEEIVTTTDGAKYDVMAGARLNFIENRIAPLCRRLEAAEQKTVETLSPGAVGWFDLESLPILQQARRDRLATARAGFEMGVPVNELNRVLDLGFRHLPWGDTGYVPATMQRVGEEAPPAARAPTAQPPAALPAGAQMLERAERFFTAMIEPPSTRAAAAMINPGGWSKAAAGKLGRFLFEQRGRVLDNLERCQKEASVLPAELCARRLFDLPQEEQRLQALIVSAGVETPSAFAAGLNQTVFDSLQTALQGARQNPDLKPAIRAAFNAVWKNLKF